MASGAAPGAGVGVAGVRSVGFVGAAAGTGAAAAAAAAGPRLAQGAP